MELQDFSYFTKSEDFVGICFTKYGLPIQHNNETFLTMCEWFYKKKPK